MQNILGNLQGEREKGRDKIKLKKKKKNSNNNKKEKETDTKYKKKKKKIQQQQKYKKTGRGRGAESTNTVPHNYPHSPRSPTACTTTTGYLTHTVSYLISLSLFFFMRITKACTMRWYLCHPHAPLRGLDKLSPQTQSHIPYHMIADVATSVEDFLLPGTNTNRYKASFLPSALSAFNENYTSH